MNTLQPHRRWLGDRLTAGHLDKAIADKFPNAADSSPIPLQTEPDHFGATAKDAARRRFNDTTERFPRTLREAQRNPRDWWTTAEAAIAEEEYIREMFAKSEQQEKTPGHDRVLYLIGALVVILYFLGAFK
jgi:hypothetical protein